jgi:hypothetical protein
MKISVKKKIPVRVVYRTIGDKNSGVWNNGKVYMPLMKIAKGKRDMIVEAIKLGSSRRYLYTLDKKKRVSGFAPKTLMKR